MAEVIRYLPDEEKNRTRALWERIFVEDSERFLDYYYHIKTADNEILVLERDGEILSMLQLNPYRLQLGAAQVEAAAKVLEQRIRQFAKDIHTKYIHVPETTDFGIMFLPIEGLYAEVVRRGMVERLQAEFKVVIAGPTTMAALLNSLQMGFKTLAIQKRSSEVWDVLSSVKSEFETFGTALEQAQTRINQAGNALESLVGVRTRQIQRKLRSVTTLPEAGAAGEALEE